MQLVQATSGDFLHDLSNFSNFQTECEALTSDILEYCKQEHNKWCKDLEKLVSSQKSEMELKGSMISLDQGKKLMVNYSPRLVTLLREVRQLSILGLKIPTSIKDIANTAQQFYTHAIVLKQIANFYNTVHSQIIKSQSEMLIDAASEFEDVIFSFEKQQQSWQRIRASSLLRNSRLLLKSSHLRIEGCASTTTLLVKKLYSS